MQHLIEYYKHHKSSHLSTQHPEFYQLLIDSTSFLPSNVSSTRRLWHHWNNVFHLPVCAQCTVTGTNWDTVNQTYRMFCSSACSTTHRNSTKQQRVNPSCVVCHQPVRKKLDGFRATCSTKCSKIHSENQTSQPMTKDEVLEYVSTLPTDYNYRRFRGQHTRCFVQIGKLTANLPTSYQIKDRIDWLLGSKTTRQESNEIKTSELFPAAPSVRAARAMSRGLHTCPMCKSKRQYDGVTNRYPKYCSLECSESYQKTRLIKKLLSILKGYKHRHDSTPPNKNLSNQLNDKEWLESMHHTNKFTKQQIASMLNVDGETVSNRFKSFGIESVRFPGTAAEREIVQLLREADPTLDVVSNTRSVISPKELDIYLPDKKLAIEFCGLYWHSDIHKRISNNYHQTKMLKCNQLGIRLITVFEDEWIHNKQLVVRNILHAAGYTTSAKLNARDCTIHAIDTHAKAKFFDSTHIQGDGPSSINLSMVHKGTVVAVMGFITQSNGRYTLNRYSTSTTVRGGFTKLLSAFKRQHPDWVEITTFADLRWSEGALYVNSGFQPTTTLPPDYSYIDPLEIRRVHKFNYRRALLPRKLKTFVPELSEVQNTRNNGIFRIFDCGKLKFTISQ